MCAQLQVEMKLNIYHPFAASQISNTGATPNRSYPRRCSCCRTWAWAMVPSGSWSSWKKSGSCCPITRQLTTLSSVSESQSLKWDAGLFLFQTQTQWGSKYRLVRYLNGENKSGFLIQWGSEYRTSPDFELWKVVWWLNGMNFGWHLNTGLFCLVL